MTPAQIKTGLQTMTPRERNAYFTLLHMRPLNTDVADNAMRISILHEIATENGETLKVNREEPKVKAKQGKR
jgi:hypothetical protein